MGGLNVRRRAPKGEAVTTTPDSPTEILAELLGLAADRERLVEMDQLLRELLGPAAVNEAHRIWTDRIAAALRHIGRGAPSERTGARAEPSESGLRLVRRLPDPLSGGRARQAHRARL